jgi:hypothetical protein
MFIEMFAAAALGAAMEPAQAQSRAVPPGSYSRTCIGARVSDGRLRASCRDTRGNTRDSSIELYRCVNEDIRNDDGLLSCGRWSGDREGSWASSGSNWRDRDDRRDDRRGRRGGRGEITVYRDADYRGAEFTFRGEMPNLRNTDFNDVISSMRFRGAWEVCTDAYFRGTCQIFNDDVLNLSQYGLNDRVSSLRPVRR